MKKIFDWMREEMFDYSYGYIDKLEIDLKDVKNIINEAEAKWEADCCEWKRHEEFKEVIRPPHDGYDRLEKFLKKEPFCPYCGKKIKVVE